MEAPRVCSLVTRVTETRNLPDILSGCFALEQPHSCHTCSLPFVEPSMLHWTLEKHLEMAGEGRGHPGKWSLNQALPCAMTFLGLINISGSCWKNSVTFPEAAELRPDVVCTACASDMSNNKFGGTVPLNKSILLHLNVLKCEH